MSDAATRNPQSTAAAVPVRGLEELAKWLVLVKCRTPHAKQAYIPIALVEAALVPCPAVASPAWQPIETAPKDGKRVLLGRNDGNRFTGLVGVAAWRKDHNSDQFQARIWDGWTWMLPPTHWMPLPTPPLPAVRPSPEDETDEDLHTRCDDTKRSTSKTTRLSE